MLLIPAPRCLKLLHGVQLYSLYTAILNAETPPVVLLFVFSLSLFSFYVNIFVKFTKGSARIFADDQ